MLSMHFSTSLPLASYSIPRRFGVVPRCGPASTSMSWRSPRCDSSMDLALRARLWRFKSRSPDFVAALLNAATGMCLISPAVRGPESGC